MREPTQPNPDFIPGGPHPPPPPDLVPPDDEDTDPGKAPRPSLPPGREPFPSHPLDDGALVVIDQQRSGGWSGMRSAWTILAT